MSAAFNSLRVSTSSDALGASHSSFGGDGGLGSTGQSVVSLASPSIGSGGGLDPLDLDEVEYTVRPEEGKLYWVQRCVCLKNPRVKQFIRPKFLAIILVIVLTGVFLSLAITLMTVPRFEDAVTVTEPPVTPTPDSCATSLPWPQGYSLLRNPFAPAAELVVLPFVSWVAPGSPTGTLQDAFNISSWDLIASFNGSIVRLYGSSRVITEADTGIGRLGEIDRPERFNSWGTLAERSDARADEWYGQQSIEVLLAIAASDVSSSSSSTGAAAGSSVATNDSSTGGAFSGDSSSTGASSPSSAFAGFIANPALVNSVTATATQFYLYNNRTDVHTGNYALAGVVSPAVNATSFPNNPEYNPRPLWRLRLYVQADLTLRYCADAFVESAGSSSSSSTASSVLSITSSSTGDSSSGVIESSSTGG